MSEEVNNLRITKLREWLMSIVGELNEHYKQINVNFLDDKVDNYSIDKIPMATVVDHWILGDILRQETYSFRSRMEYSADTISNIKNIGFFETFENEVKKRNDEGDLPDIDKIESIECLNCGTMVSATTNTSEFDIQIRIELKK